MSFDASIPLGKKTDYQFEYNPSLLFPIARSIGRDELGLIGDTLPFYGFDRWTAFELSWLNLKGKPEQMIAEFDFSCTAPNIVESKSFKLYLNSLNQSQFESAESVHALLKKDLSAVSGEAVNIRLFNVNEYSRSPINSVESIQLDTLDVSCDVYEVDASLLAQDAHNDDAESALQLFSFDGFRSLCPVTSQPDWASVYIHASGGNLLAESVLQYLVSFRNHQGFHEQCVEQIYTDLMAFTEFDTLTVYARFLRRGGLDINPIRSLKPSDNLKTMMPVIHRQ